MDRSCFPFPFTCSVAVARAVADYWTSARTRATVGATSFLPSLHLSPSLFLVPHPAEELGNLHILETRAPASQSVSVCFRSIPPAAYLTCKGRKNGKGSERFCTVCLFYGMFPLFLPNLLRRLVHHSSAIMWAGFARGQENRMLFDMGPAAGSHLEVLEQGGRRTRDVKFNFYSHALYAKRRIDFLKRQHIPLPRFLLSFPL